MLCACSPELPIPLTHVHFIWTRCPLLTASSTRTITLKGSWIGENSEFLQIHLTVKYFHPNLFHPNGVFQHKWESAEEKEAGAVAKDQLRQKEDYYWKQCLPHHGCYNDDSFTGTGQLSLILKKGKDQHSSLCSRDKSSEKHHSTLSMGHWHTSIGSLRQWRNLSGPLRMW